MEIQFNINQIEQAWAKDSVIDKTQLIEDAQTQYSLHQKYHRLLNHVKKMIRQVQSERTKMNLLKVDYYSNTIAPQQLKELGWQPNRRVILKGDLDKYIEADQDIIDLNLKLGDLNDMKDFLESIIKAIMQRQFTVKNILEAQKFYNGEY